MGDGPQLSSANSDRRTSARSSVELHPSCPAEAVKPLGDYLGKIAYLEWANEQESLTQGQKRLENQCSSAVRNCCGQYALATVCNAHGVEISLEQAKAATNPLGIFTGPKQMTRFLNDQNISAREVNRGSQEALAAHVERGNTAILLINADAEVGKTAPHWVVVSGVSRDRSGAVSSWKVSDAANMANTDSFMGEISNQQIMKAWSKPFGPLSGLTGYSSYFIAVGEEARFSRPLIRTLVSSGSADVVNRLANATGDGIEGVKQMKQNIQTRINSLREDVIPGVALPAPIRRVP